MPRLDTLALILLVSVTCPAIATAQTSAAIPITSVTAVVEEARLITWYRDADEDGFGSPYDTVDAEAPPLGYIIVGNDCDDRFGSIHPGAEEVCDGIDNDCDGLVDQYWSQVGRPCSAGIGECERVGIWVCSPDGRNLECDAIPGAPGFERCDGIDNDCDGLVDRYWSQVGRPCFAGIGECERVGIWVCSPDGSNLECDAPRGAPGAEICDGCVDNDCDGVIDNGCTTGVGEHAPSHGSLEINMPNPFNPQTTIRFALPRTETVHLRIFDLSGRLVKTLIDGQSVPAGWHSVSWNGRDESSRLVASGVFFYSIEAGDFVESRRMTLLK